MKIMVHQRTNCRRGNAPSALSNVQAARASLEEMAEGPSSPLPPASGAQARCDACGQPLPPATPETHAALVRSKQRALQTAKDAEEASEERQRHLEGAAAEAAQREREAGDMHEALQEVTGPLRHYITTPLYHHAMHCYC